MTEVHHGLEGIIAFETQIAEPDKEGSALRYRGVDIEELCTIDRLDLVGDGVDHGLISTFGEVGDAFDELHERPSSDSGSENTSKPGRLCRLWSSAGRDCSTAESLPWRTRDLIL